MNGFRNAEIIEIDKSYSVKIILNNNFDKKQKFILYKFLIFYEKIYNLNCLKLLKSGISNSNIISDKD